MKPETYGIRIWFETKIMDKAVYHFETTILRISIIITF